MKKFYSVIFVFLMGILLCHAQEKLPVATVESQQPMVALFGTNSFVPSLPLRAYQTCDSSLATSILKHECRLRGRGEADQALQRVGVTRLVELTALQAKALMEELNCVALVQLTITEYRLRSACRQGNRPQKNLPATLQIATLAGEIQVWSQGDLEPKCMEFHRTLTDQDPNLPCLPGENDKNSFGVLALEYALEQAMGEFKK